MVTSSSPFGCSLPITQDLFHAQRKNRDSEGIHFQILQLPAHGGPILLAEIFG
jgi:hypothetical protein